MKKQKPNSSQQNNAILIAALLLFLAVLGFLGAYWLFSPDTAAGAKAITIQVVDDTNNTTEYHLYTDTEYLIDAMKEIPKFSFSGYESQYGLTLTAINGITADWEKNNAYWSIYVNDAVGNYGVSSQPINDGDTFRFEYTRLNSNA